MFMAEGFTQHVKVQQPCPSMYCHMGQLVRRELLLVFRPQKKKREKHDQVSKFCFTFQKKSAKTCAKCRCV